MPYLRCHNCGVTTYSAPSYAGVGSCSNCCARLHADTRIYQDVDSDRPETLTRRLSPDVTAPARARHAVAELRGAIGTERFPDVQLMLSELVTNAVRHGHHDGGRSIAVAIDLRPGTVRVTVGDDGAGFHTPQPADGCGLLIVDKLAARWGVDPQPPTTVWFELDTNGRAAAAS